MTKIRQMMIISSGINKKLGKNQKKVKCNYFAKIVIIFKNLIPFTERKRNQTTKTNKTHREPYPKKEKEMIQTIKK